MRVLSQKDRWVGEAITRVRVTYENWAGLTSGEIRIEPEYCRGPIRSRHVQLFANYAKEAFLTAVAVLHRGFFIRRPLFYFSRTGSVAFLSSRNPHENRMAQAIIPGPFCEFHLTNHQRFNPNASLHFGGR
jgi:hypothetical protein